jgi:hypothetical protein
MAKTPQIPLAEVMKAIDKKDRGWYNKLTDEKKKAFSAWMMMRYASSVQGNQAPDYLWMVNELVNHKFSDVSKHPELQWLLFTAAGSGKVQNHPYIKPPNSKRKKNKRSQFVFDQMPHLKQDEIDLMLTLNSDDDLKDYARASGLSDKDIKDIFK